MRFRAENITASASSNPRLGLEVTNRCNSACIHCFAGTGSGASAQIPTEVAKDILLEGYFAAYRHLHITGGEPLLYNAIFEILDYALDLGYETMLVNTNGLLLTGRICRTLADYPGLSVTISLEGTALLHERFRGTRSHKQVLTGLENAIAAGLDVIVFTTAAKSLLPELPEFADFLVSRFPGIKYLTLIRLVTAEGRTSRLEEEFLNPGDFLGLANMVALINLYGLRTRLLNDPLINVVSRKLGMPWTPRSSDLDLEGSLMVGADLSVRSSHAGRHNYENYAPGSIAKILVSDQYRQASAPDSQICPACGYVELCRDSGLFRPAKWHLPGKHDSSYCKNVLDLLGR